jgi:hypothetical protein
MAHFFTCSHCKKYILGSIFRKQRTLCKNCDVLTIKEIKLLNHLNDLKLSN